jgi:hypothetical protein
VLVVWEDDDIYLFWHITAYVEALTDGGFSKPPRALSHYTGMLSEEELRAASMQASRSRKQHSNQPVFDC